jgi:hypothetical protein
MKRRLKRLAATVGMAITVGATAFSASASAPGLTRAEAVGGAESSGAAQAACTTMRGGPVGWVTLDEDGDIDEQVTAYPADTSLITPVFEYNCIPKKVTLVTVFTYKGETVFTDKESLRASNRSGLYGYPLTTDDGSPLGDGEWGVAFYNNKTLLTKGTVIIGEEGGTQASTTVIVQGLVRDKKTRKPIRGAVILVLKPGVTIQRFLDRGQKDSDVLTAGQTDSKGKFVIEKALQRGTSYSLIVVARGYKPVGQDGMQISANDPNPLELTITMTK